MISPTTTWCFIIKDRNFRDFRWAIWSATSSVFPSTFVLSFPSLLSVELWLEQIHLACWVMIRKGPTYKACDRLRLNVRGTKGLPKWELERIYPCKPTCKRQIREITRLIVVLITMFSENTKSMIENFLQQSFKTFSNINFYWLEDQESTKSNMNFQNLTWFETVYCSRC